MLKIADKAILMLKIADKANSKINLYFMYVLLFQYLLKFGSFFFTKGISILSKKTMTDLFLLEQL